MKKINIKFHYNGTAYNKEAFINNDINMDSILAEHKKNKNVTAEYGMADDLGIWSLNFDEPYMKIECDFVSKPLGNGFEHLTLDPVEIILWSNGGTYINTDTIPFTIDVTDI